MYNIPAENLLITKRLIIGRFYSEPSYNRTQRDQSFSLSTYLLTLLKQLVVFFFLFLIMYYMQPTLSTRRNLLVPRDLA